MTTSSSIAAPDAATALRIAGLTKIFGEQRALDGVDLTVLRGEIHALLGENGSGKSTLIKVLSGLYDPDGGTLEVYGENIDLPMTATRASAIGIEFVHQDLGLIPSLSVAENLLLGELSSGASGTLVSDRSMRRAASAVLETYGVPLDVAAPVASLAPVERALLAIIRAIHAIESRGAGESGATGILVLDEPTVFLPRADVDRVFDLIRRLAAAGCSVVLVSHDLDEVLEVAHVVTVLRDGSVAGGASTASLGRDDLVQLIVGRAVDLVNRPPARARDLVSPPALAVEGLVADRLSGVSITVARGEILGLTGLAGSGYERLPYLLYGAAKAQAGTVRVAGGDAVELRTLTTRGARRRGIGLLPSDRRNTAGIGSLDIVDNITMLRLSGFRRLFGLGRSAMRTDSARLMDEFDVRPRDPSHLFGTLSGGNQQKALLAKWLAAQPRVLIIDEPTQGVDIGARSQIFDLLRTAADSGISIVCASTDHEQLAVLTDRTIIFDRGTVRTQLVGDELSKHAISEACLAGSRNLVP